MKIIIMLLLMILSVFSCKTFKERKQCLEFVEGKTALDINSFEELKEYTKAVINYEKVLWVVDGRISSKKETLKLIKNRNILSIDNIKGANGAQLDEKGNGVVIITTNECLAKVKLIK